MKIKEVTSNNRKRQFEIRTRQGSLVFPHSMVTPEPRPDDPIQELFVDRELGEEAFTYRLASGEEGSVHLDAVLEYERDPDHMAELALYELTARARDELANSKLSMREIARRMHTSPAQLYRLVDPTNYNKSLNQLMSLLYVLGCEVHLEVEPRAR